MLTAFFFATPFIDEIVLRVKVQLSNTGTRRRQTKTKTENKQTTSDIIEKTLHDSDKNASYHQLKNMSRLVLHFNVCLWQVQEWNLCQLWNLFCLHRASAGKPRLIHTAPRTLCECCYVSLCFRSKTREEAPLG